jgi:membrane-bound metal-dependent hydrolase YbcI (DUF457 family)
MATVFTHAAVALALGTALRRPGPGVRFWLAGAACAMAPDLDVIGLSFGVPWGHVLGHRGLTHSLSFAAVLAAVVVVAAFRGPAWDGRRARVWLFLFVATASHGVLDAMTDGGSGSRSGATRRWPLLPAVAPDPGVADRPPVLHGARRRCPRGGAAPGVAAARGVRRGLRLGAPAARALR